MQHRPCVVCILALSVYSVACGILCPKRDGFPPGLGYAVQLMHPISQAVCESSLAMVRARLWKISATEFGYNHAL